MGPSTAKQIQFVSTAGSSFRYRRHLPKIKAMEIFMPNRVQRHLARINRPIRGHTQSNTNTEPDKTEQQQRINTTSTPATATRTKGNKNERASERKKREGTSKPLWKREINTTDQNRSDLSKHSSPGRFKSVLLFVLCVCV